MTVTSNNTNSQQTIQPELLHRREVAALLNCSDWSVREMDKRGLMPAPVSRHVKGLGTQWSRRELIDWIAAHCPERDNWRGRRATDQKLEQQIFAKAHTVKTLDQAIAERERRLEALDKRLEAGGSQ